MAEGAVQRTFTVHRAPTARCAREPSPGLSTMARRGGQRSALMGRDAMQLNMMAEVEDPTLPQAYAKPGDVKFSKVDRPLMLWEVLTGSVHEHMATVKLQSIWRKKRRRLQLETHEFQKYVDAHSGEYTRSATTRRTARGPSPRSSGACRSSRPSPSSRRRCASSGPTSRRGSCASAGIGRSWSTSSARSTARSGAARRSRASRPRRRRSRSCGRTPSTSPASPASSTC